MFMNPGTRSLSYRLFILTFAVLATLLVALGFVDHYTTKGVEYVSRDTIMQAKAERDIQPEVVMVDIDEASIQTVGAWPWDRGEIATLVQRLQNQFGARISVLDVVLPSPRDAAGDRALAYLANDKKLVLAQVFDFVKRDSLNNSGVAAGANPIADSPQQPPVVALPQAIAATGLVGNHAGFSKAPCVGNIGFIPDSDGKLRRLIQTTQWEGNTYPSLSLATSKCLGLPLPAAPTAIQTLQFDIDPQAWTVIPAHPNTCK